MEQSTVNTDAPARVGQKHHLEDAPIREDSAKRMKSILSEIESEHGSETSDQTHDSETSEDESSQEGTSDDQKSQDEKLMKEFETLMDEFSQQSEEVLMLFNQLSRLDNDNGPELRAMDGFSDIYKLMEEVHGILAAVIEEVDDEENEEQSGKEMLKRNQDACSSEDLEAPDKRACLD